MTDQVREAVAAQGVAAQGTADLRREQALDFVCLLVTDIGTHDSVMLTDGRDEIVKCIDYPKLETGLYELAGIVSRKKQLLPHLILTLHKARKES